MRIKNFVIEKRSATYSEYSASLMNVFSKNIMNLEKMFDAMASLEDFIVLNIHEEVAELIDIRSRKEEISKNESPVIYINKYFVPKVKSLSAKIEDLKKDWDSSRLENVLSFQRIIENITEIKIISKRLDSNVEYDSVKSILSLKGLINEFGKFQVIKALLTENIIDKINILLQVAMDKNKQTLIEESENLTIDNL